MQTQQNQAVSVNNLLNERYREILSLLVTDYIATSDAVGSRQLSKKILRRLSLAWGVLPVRSRAPLSLDEVFEQATEVIMTTGIAGRGDLIIITAGFPLDVPGSTNLIKVHRI